MAALSWARTRKYYDVPAKKGEERSVRYLYQSDKVQGLCRVCRFATRWTTTRSRWSRLVLPRYRSAFNFFRKIGPTPKTISTSERSPTSCWTRNPPCYMWAVRALVWAAAKRQAIRMMLAATGFVHKPENIGIVASTGCNTVYSSTYPYNPYLIPWTNSLFENGGDGDGNSSALNQLGWQKKRLWVIGGDGAMYDIGFDLSRLLASGMDIKVLVLDTQVYSNTGGQASTASFPGQDAKMAAFGRAHGRGERRKELSQICFMHPDVYVAQTTPSHINHFYKAVMEANEYAGPAVINVYTCQPEHGVPDCNSARQKWLSKHALSRSSSTIRARARSFASA